MFAFNPPQYNNGANFIAQAGQNLAAGIDQAGTGISDAIRQMHQLNIAQQQAQGAIGAAHGLGVIDDKTLAQFDNMPREQQIGFSAQILPLITAQGNNFYKQALLGVKQQTADNKTQTVPLY